MSENEKKVMELSEDDLEEVAGGGAWGSQYRRTSASSAAAASAASARQITCAGCGSTYRVTANVSSRAVCPNCGARVS